MSTAATLLSLLPRPSTQALVTAFLLGIACNRSAAADVVARVGSIDVTAEELRAYVETLGPQEQAALTRDPSRLSQVVRAYLARQAVLKEAQAKKWDQQPAIKAQLDRVREQALTELYLQSVSRPPDGFPSDAEIQTAYNANQAAFEAPRQYRLAQIFVAAGGADQISQDKARQRVEALAKKLKQKGADFAALARSESDEKEAAQRGGEIGWLTDAQMIPGIRTTVSALARDAVSEPIRLEDGWHVIKLLDQKPAATRPLAEVRETIAAQLRSARSQANRQAYLAKLLEQNPPAINELALAKVISKVK